MDELWQTDMEGALFAAAPHTGMTELANNVNRIRLGTQCKYYNSGVLLIDLARARAEIEPESLYRYIEAHRSGLLLPDQDVLNAMFGDRILPLDDFRWNYDARNFTNYYMRSSGMADSDWVMRNTAILHFCGKAKPWKPFYRYRFECCTATICSWRSARSEKVRRSGRRGRRRERRFPHLSHSGGQPMDISMKPDLRGKTAVVTGGSGVLGSCMARALAACGARTAILARGLPRAQAAAGAIAREGGEAFAAACDATDKSSLEPRARPCSSASALRTFSSTPPAATAPPRPPTPSASTPPAPEGRFSIWTKPPSARCSTSTASARCSPRRCSRATWPAAPARASSTSRR